MPHADLAITNARLVASAGTFRGSLTVTGERITGVLAPRDTPKAARVIDAEGRYVFPGVIDPHTHPGCRNPLKADFRTESQAAAAGGITTYGIMVGSGRASRTFKEFVINQ